MPNIAKVLKDEIARVAKKQVKSFVTPLHHQQVALKKALVVLKRTMAGLEKNTAQLVKESASRAAAAPAVEPAAESGKRMWIFSKGIRSMRKKLNVSQAEFAKLIGVSAQAVTLWENKGGKLDLRQSTKQALVAIRGIGAREARRRLDAMGVVKSRRGRKPAAAAPVAKAAAPAKAKRGPKAK